MGGGGWGECSTCYWTNTRLFGPCIKKGYKVAGVDCPDYRPAKTHRSGRPKDRRGGA